MSDEQRREKGTCCVCGARAPDSVVCDSCFLKNVVKPTMEAIARSNARDRNLLESNNGGIDR